METKKRKLMSVSERLGFFKNLEREGSLPF